MSAPTVAVVGTCHTPARRRVDDQSLEEMVFAATGGALRDAGLSITDIDAVVLSTADQLSGRIIESMVVNGAAGGVARDVTTLASAGEHAFVYAYLALLAGQASRVLVAVWSKQSESVDPAHADWLGAEPFLLRRAGMTSVAAAGLQASAYVGRYGLDPEAVTALRSARLNATRAGETGETATNGNPSTPTGSGRMLAWPLTDLDLPQGADMACAAVLTTAENVGADQRPAWIRGVGWATDRYELGDRDLTGFDALRAASRMALGSDRAAGGIDVLEVQEISTVGAFGAVEALGLADAGAGARVAAEARVNPSGGNLYVDPGNASGVLRFLNAADQVRGAAEAAQQVSPRPRTALGAALHGFAGQGAAVVSFTAEPADIPSGAVDAPSGEGVRS